MADDKASARTAPPIDAQLSLKRRRARLVLGWERLWPALVPPLCVAGLFLAASWFGLWLALPRMGRIAGLAAFAILLLLALRPLIRFRLPTWAEATARLDRDAGIAHRPVTTMTDTLAGNATDPVMQALWQRHQARARAALDAVRLAPPQPAVRRQDPMALRAAVVLGLLASAWLAGPERTGRIAAAFDVLTPPPPPVPTRLDAWVDPPPYTGRPPIFLTHEAAGDGKPQTGATGAAKPLQVPEKSVVVLRASPATGVAISAEGALFPKQGGDKQNPDSIERRFVLAGAGAAVVTKGGAPLARFSLEAVPDLPPTISLAAPPERGDHETLLLRYRGHDDYGIASLTAEFAPLAKADAPAPRTLMPPPAPALNIPPQGDGSAITEATLELGDHPWAGARVRMTLVARDDAGHEARTPPVDVVIPQRIFTDPLAKALVEQRRDLILDPDHPEKVQIALDALLTAPELFTPAIGTFLALETVAAQLRDARSDPELVAVADWLWTIALELEDGGMSNAEKALHQAQERLRDAIDRNASAEEIRRLTRELRQAMNNYMREMAERAQRDPNRQAERPDGQEKVITQDDLRKMMDQIEKLAREGKQAEAQQLLEQLNRMMENMRMAQNRQAMDPRQKQMNEALDELDQMTREQQELRDRTFRRQEGRQGRQGDRRQQGRNGRQQGEQQGQGDDSQTLRDRQQALREQLGRMRERMRQGGLGDQPELGEAEREMRDAEGKLGQGQDRGAADAQGRALDSLQRSGRKLAEQMMQEGNGPGQMGQQGEGNQPGGRDGLGRRYGEGRDGDRDPLGRSRRGQLNPDSRFNEKLGLEPGERANRILEELRRRLGQQNRPAYELDYLDRLLKREQ